MKTVLFVPGFQEDMKSRNYTATLRAIQDKGYSVEFVKINWRYTNLTDWVKTLESEYLKHDPKEVALAGFSFGAMAAFVVAAKKNPAELWLFSLSCWWKEDLEDPKWNLINVGKRRTEEFRNYSFNKLAQDVKCKTLIFVGEKEAARYPELRKVPKSHIKS